MNVGSPVISRIGRISTPGAAVGLAADPVPQLVIDDELARAGVRRHARAGTSWSEARRG